MSVLQDLQYARESIGGEKFKLIEEFLKVHPHLYLDDVYYRENIRKQFDTWCESRKSYSVFLYDEKEEHTFSIFDGNDEEIITVDATDEAKVENTIKDYLLGTYTSHFEWEKKGIPFTPESIKTYTNIPIIQMNW